VQPEGAGAPGAATSRPRLRSGGEGPSDAPGAGASRKLVDRPSQAARWAPAPHRAGSPVRV